VERAEQEVVARRARRVLWAFRMLFYGGAALAALLLLTAGGNDERPAFAEGRTSQGQVFTMQLDDGRPASLGTHFSATCNPTLDWHARWWSFDGKTARFDFDDGVLCVREKLTRDYRDGWIGDRDYRLEARVDDEGVSGTMRYVETLRYGNRAGYVCESGDVSFSAG
jgi:hypothetical protein